MQREHLGARGVQSKEDGFTLLELMMVILIIGILIAVLTPTLLGASNRAKDRAMQTSLTNAGVGAKGFYLAKADYTGLTPALLTADVGGGTAGSAGLVFVGAGSGPVGVNQVSVNPLSSSQIVLSGQSKTGTCFYLMDDETAGTVRYAALPGIGGCAANTIIPTDPAWKTAW